MSSWTHRGFVRLRRILLGSVLLAVLNVAFAALIVTETVTPSLGLVLAGASGRQFILNTDGTVSGANAADYLVGAVSGQVEVRKTQGPGDFTIVADVISTTGGVTVNAIPCRWHNDPQTTCDPPGIAAGQPNNTTQILYVGVDITTSQAHSDGDIASVTYEITVTVL